MNGWMDVGCGVVWSGRGASFVFWVGPHWFCRAAAPSITRSCRVAVVVANAAATARSLGRHTPAGARRLTTHHTQHQHDTKYHIPFSHTTHKPTPKQHEPPQEEVLNTARALGALPGFSLLMVDTENKFVSTGAYGH